MTVCPSAHGKQSIYPKKTEAFLDSPHSAFNIFVKRQSREILPHMHANIRLPKKEDLT